MNFLLRHLTRKNQQPRKARLLVFLTAYARRARIGVDGFAGCLQPAVSTITVEGEPFAPGGPLAGAEAVGHGVLVRRAQQVADAFSGNVALLRCRRGREDQECTGCQEEVHGSTYLEGRLHCPFTNALAIYDIKYV